MYIYISLSISPSSLSLSLYIYIYIYIYIRKSLPKAVAGDIVALSVTGFVPKWTQTLAFRATKDTVSSHNFNSQEIKDSVQIASKYIEL